MSGRCGIEGSMVVGRIVHAILGIMIRPGLQGNTLSKENHTQHNLTINNQHQDVIRDGHSHGRKPHDGVSNGRRERDGLFSNSAGCVLPSFSQSA